jgi:hypothetical protein
MLSPEMTVKKIANHLPGSDTKNQGCGLESGNYVRTYLNIVTHNKGNARIGVKIYGKVYRFLANFFVRFSTKNGTLPLGELLPKLATPANKQVLYFRNS